MAYRIGGLATVLFELLAGVVLFTTWGRPWAIGAAVVFHGGIQLVLKVESLGFHFLWMLATLFATEGQRGRREVFRPVNFLHATARAWLKVAALHGER